MNITRGDSFDFGLFLLFFTLYLDWAIYIEIEYATFHILCIL